MESYLGLLGLFAVLIGLLFVSNRLRLERFEEKKEEAPCPECGSCTPMMIISILFILFVVYKLFRYFTRSAVPLKAPKPPVFM
jgi:hypothetical protein